MSGQRSRPEADPKAAQTFGGVETSVTVTSDVALQPRGHSAECPTCRRFGLFYPDGGRRCSQHATPADVELLEELDERGAAIGLPRDVIGSRRWTYGPNIHVTMRQRMLTWAETHSLTFADRGHGCLDWVRRGGCYGSGCYAPPSDWMDHVTCWKRDGAPAVLVAQPYQLGESDGVHLGELAAEAALRLELLEEGAWYGPGSWFIGVWRAGA